MANMTLNDLYSIKVNYAKTIELLNKGNIAAAIDYFEKMGYTMLNFDQKTADKCFQIFDKYSDIIGKIENRIPSTYEAFKKEVVNYYLYGPISVYLKQNSRQCNDIISYSNDIIIKAKNHNSAAFDNISSLSNVLKTVDYTIGYEYSCGVKAISISYDGYNKLINLTQEKCGAAFKKLILEVDNKIR